MTAYDNAVPARLKQHGLVHFLTVENASLTYVHRSTKDVYRHEYVDIGTVRHWAVGTCNHRSSGAILNVRDKERSGRRQLMNCG